MHKQISINVKILLDYLKNKMLELKKQFFSQLQM